MSLLTETHPPQLEPVVATDQIPRPEINPDLLESGRSSSTITYSTTSEAAFDNAIARSDILRALAVITDLMDSHEVFVDKGIYNATMFHAAIKEIAMPLYVRADKGWSWEQERSEERDIQSVDYHAIRLLIFLKDWYERVEAGEPDLTTEQTLKDLKGDMGELLVFLLVTRNILGDDEDNLNILPATQSEDMAGINNKGLKMGTDFIVEHLHTRRKLPVQVKMSDHDAAGYDPKILVVVVQRLVNGGYDKVIELQEAIIAEYSEEETMEQRWLIEAVSKKLHQDFYKKLAGPSLRMLVPRLKK